MKYKILQSKNNLSGKWSDLFVDDSESDLKLFRELASAFLKVNGFDSDTVARMLSETNENYRVITREITVTETVLWKL